LHLYSRSINCFKTKSFNFDKSTDRSFDIVVNWAKNTEHLFNSKEFVNITEKPLQVLLFYTLKLLPHLTLLNLF